MNGRILSGEVISELSIAKKLGISRTPVGEAVRLLAREGLVDQVPRYGTVVRRLERADIEEHYELREALESYAAGQAAARAMPADVARIRELCDSVSAAVETFNEIDGAGITGPDLRKFLAADMAFHLSIVQAAGNRQIMNSVHSSRSLFRIFALRRQRHDLNVVRDACKQHREIFEAIAAGESDRASASMLNHIRQSKKKSIEYYDLEARRGNVGIPGLPVDVQEELNKIENTLAGRREIEKG